MRDFQHKNKNNVFKRIVYSSFGVGVLSAILIVFAWGVLHFMFKLRDTNENKKVAEVKVSELERRKAKLAGDIADLNSDKGKERIFREDYGMAREGEGLVIVVDDSVSASSGAASEQETFFFRTKAFINKLLNN